MKKLILILLFIPFVIFSQNETINRKQTNLSIEDKSEKNKNPFLDCDTNDISCFQNLFNKHVVDNFKYPELGNYFDVQAIVYVDYTIDTNGFVGNISSKAALIGVSFEDIESKKIMSAAFENAANLIIENLPQMKPLVIDGVATSKKFRTPILYRLPDVDKDLIISINVDKINRGLDFLNKLDNDEPSNYEITENVPVFPGCEDVEESEKRDCFQKKIQRHISRNFKYPKIAQKKGIQGRVYVQFIIGIDGGIRRIRSRGPHHSLESAAERIISLLPNMKPGRINGVRVEVPFSIPITYRLGTPKP